MISGKKIVITGGAGFIGSNLVDSLAGSNEVTVIDNMHTGSRNNIKKHLESGRVTLIDKDVKDIGNTGVDPDYIFHLGMYSSSPMYKDDNYKVSGIVDGAISLFKFASKKGSKVILASSSSVYNGNEPPYKEEMQLKVTDFYTEARIYVERLAELYSRMEGLSVTAIRFFSVYGPHEESKKQYANLITQFIWAINRGEAPVIYGDGRQTRDFVYVGDIVSALEKAAGIKGEYDVFNAGTGKSYTLNEMVSILGREMGVEIKPEYVDKKAKNYVEHTRADISKAERVLGFKAEYTLEKGIRNCIEYYKGMKI